MGTRVGKQDLITIISDKTGYTKKSVDDVVSAFLSVIEEKVVAHDDVVIPGFGSWKVQQVSERKGRNIRNNEEIVIPAHSRIKFTPGHTFKTNLQTSDTAAVAAVAPAKKSKKRSKKS